MAPATPGDGMPSADSGGAPGVLEAQVREVFGRVVYSHKTHEKCADLAQ